MPGADTPYPRRDVLRMGGALGAFLALGGLPSFATPASADPRPPLALAPQPRTLWYRKPGGEAKIIEEGLPVGNGRLGALVTGDPARDALYLTDATLWTGGLNATLGDDGQFPYGPDDFGTLSLLAKAFLEIPGHATVTGYQRQLDLDNGLVSARYVVGGVTYTREVFSSHPDDVLVVRLTQSGGGTYTGTLHLAGTHGETTTSSAGFAGFSGKLGNGLRYAACATAKSTSGTVTAAGDTLSFTGCSEVLIVLSGGTDYAPDATTGYRDPRLDPAATARAKATVAIRAGGPALTATHVADFRTLAGASTVDLGASTAAQRALETPARLAARAVPGAAPDPELEAAYLQFGRYLLVAGSRTSVPLNLQGLWLDRNNPDWMSDYHTDINVQMNYWLPDRAGLPSTFDAFARYCAAQLPSWTKTTQALFDDPRNGFRNTSGKVAGWTTAISTNIHGGGGWWWHPAGGAWLCVSLFEHYQYTKDSVYLRTIYPLLKGACEFWAARLVTATVGGRDVLIDDHDWSPEQGPTDARGITYAQELVWQLFAHYREAATTLGLDAGYAATIAGLQAKLYLPVVSPTTGKLEEWMTDADLGDPAHRHLSPLAGLFPGDRIAADTAPEPLLDGVRALLTARGMHSFGWACAWRALCWARLKDADRAYQLITTVLTPSVNFSNGAAANLFDMYSFGSRSTFQIDANFGTPAAMLETLLYSRPGLIELLPALPTGWPSGQARGLGARGGFSVDLSWHAGQVTTVTVHSVHGGTTTVRSGAWHTDVTVAPGRSVTLTPPPRKRVYRLVNRKSGKVLDVPGSATTPGTALIQYADRGGANQQWVITDTGDGHSVVNVHSGLAAEVRTGDAVAQWRYTGSAGQRWTITQADEGYVKLVNHRSGRLLVLQG